MIIFTLMTKSLKLHIQSYPMYEALLWHHDRGSTKTTLINVVALIEKHTKPYPFFFLQFFIVSQIVYVI